MTVPRRKFIQALAASAGLIAIGSLAACVLPKPFQLTDLEDGVTYSVVVKSTFSGGTSLESAPVLFTYRSPS